MSVSELAERWGFAPDSALLTQALTHRSAAPHPHSNERLEFLGDALLGLYVAQILMAALPDAAEGILTLARASVVDRETQADIAQLLGIPELLRVDAGGHKMGLPQQTRLLSGAYEALVGALYLEQGDAVARTFVQETLAESLATVVRNPSNKHPKSRLQELLQSQGRKKPEYRVTLDLLAISGSVTVTVLCDGVLLGEGEGRALRIAERRAAEAALHHLTESPSGSIL